MLANLLCNKVVSKLARKLVSKLFGKIFSGLPIWVHLKVVSRFFLTKLSTDTFFVNEHVKTLLPKLLIGNFC